MKHTRENDQKHSNIRISVEMLPKPLQKASRDKQVEVMKRMLKKACISTGLNREMKEREHYVSRGEKRRYAKRLKQALAKGEVKVNNCHEDQDYKSYDEYNY